MDWKDPSIELPPYETPVLIWIGCEKCRNKQPHAHTCLAHPANYPESFQRGTYHKAWTEKRKGEKVSVHYDYLFVDHWSPCPPYRWAYVTPPPGCE